LDFRRDLGASLWWRHELLHRAVLRDYAAWAPQVHAAVAQLQPDMIALAEAACSGGSGHGSLALSDRDPAVQATRLHEVSALAFRVDDLLRARLLAAMRVTDPLGGHNAGCGGAGARAAAEAVEISDLVAHLSEHWVQRLGGSFRRTRRASSVGSVDTVGAAGCCDSAACPPGAGKACAGDATSDGELLAAIHTVLNSPAPSPPPSARDDARGTQSTPAPAPGQQLVPSVAPDSSRSVGSPSSASVHAPGGHHAAATDRPPDATHARWIGAVEWVLRRLPLSEAMYFMAWDEADDAAGLPPSSAARSGAPCRPPTPPDRVWGDVRAAAASAAVAAATVITACLGARAVRA
jgi:hypothetical protein